MGKGSNLESTEQPLERRIKSQTKRKHKNMTLSQLIADTSLEFVFARPLNMDTIHQFSQVTNPHTSSPSYS